MITVPQPPDRPRRVTFVNRFFYPDESATAQMLTDLAVFLAEQGWTVTVVTSRFAGTSADPLARSDEHRGVRILRVASLNLGRKSTLHRLLEFASFYPSALLALVGTLNRGEIVVSKTDPPLISVIAAIASKVRGASLVTWLQDVYPEVAQKLGEPIVGGFLGAPLLRLRNWALSRARANVAIGTVMRSFIADQAGAETRSHHIRNWTDETAISPRPPFHSAARARWGYTDDNFVVGYSGNLGRAHEADTLIQAAQLLRHRSKIHFLIIGSGTEYDRLRAAAKLLGLGRFRFQSHQPREHLADTLSAADVHWLSLKPELEGLIVPSKFYGILAAGRPVIAVSAKDGELGTEVTRHNCGIAVTPGDGQAFADAITMLADNPSLCAEMGNAARRAVEGPLSRRSAQIEWERLLTKVASEDAAEHTREPGSR